MSLQNKKEEKRRHTDIRVTKDLFKRNPTIIDDFCKWYPTYAKDNPILPNDIDAFFNIAFKWVIWVWWDYFYVKGIDIAIGENKAYVFFHSERKDSEYFYLSIRKEIFYIESDANPTDKFEEAIAELICRIELPF